MAVMIPEDLEAWRRWQERRRGARGLRARLRLQHEAPQLAVRIRGERPTVLLAIDSRSLSGIASLQVLIDRFPELAVVSSVHSSDELALLFTDSIPAGFDSLVGLHAVVASGHYLPAGASAWRLAMQRSIPNIVVQHGLTTPFAPPLPRNAHLLAFSDEDAAFWASGRSDISWSVTGSQLLWQAGSYEATSKIGRGPYYLGQLHGAELSRRRMVRATQDFWRETGAVYRPHPSEVDRLSRLQHAHWERRGMLIDRSRTQLIDLDGPVVAAFSTGIVEAAAAGLPAWGYVPNAPRWVEEFWERYGISRWGIDSTPTHAPARTRDEPAAAIAAAVIAISEGDS